MLALIAIATLQNRFPKWVNPAPNLAIGVVHATLHSPANSHEIGYSIYLPKGYRESTRKYPLLIFLHGAGGSETSDARVGGFTTVVEKAIAAKALPSCVVLFANGLMSGYRDSSDKKQFIETHVMKELIPHIEKTYRAGGRRDMRLISGFSMGGAGSCRLAMAYPEFFAGAVAWGGSVRDGDLEAVSRLFLGIGELDGFAKAEDFQSALKKEGVSFESVVLKGVGHDLGEYYSQTAHQGFGFVSQSLGKEAWK
ncbi:MAG: hypothetical protein H7Y17_14435 [Chlorobia bacterium]|nr:hypothetical protein [Fimbriimonadaceae bacterium]